MTTKALARLIPILVAGALPWTGLAAPAPALADPPPAGELAFERYELVTGPAASQTVLTGSLLGGEMAELAVLSLDRSGGRRLRIYAFGEGGWVPVTDAALGGGVAFVDLAEIGGRDRLITYWRGRLSWFDPESATERPLVEIAASYRVTETDHIPHVDITRDLNRDGRDDLVMPAVDGFWIATQASDGSFTEPVKLGPPEPFARAPVGRLDAGEPASRGPRTYGEIGITAATVPVYLGRIHLMDYDQDGLSDLVFWNEDHFDVHLQDASGRFSTAAETFAPGVPFDSDGVYTRAFEYSDQGMFGLLLGVGKKTERTVLHSLRDLNGDGVADLVTLTLAGPSITRQRSVYRVHYGISTPDGTAFTREAGTTLLPRGKAGGMQPWGYSAQRFQDLDGDGQLDIVFQDVRVGIGGMMRALVGNSVPINLELYRGEDGIYPDRPTARRKIRRFAPFAGLGKVFFPVVLMGDVDGDGRSDLLVGRSPRELQVFVGVPGPEMLARRPQRVAVDLPYNERNIRLADLDRDGRQDLLVHHAATARAPDEPHRLLILIAR